MPPIERNPQWPENWPGPIYPDRPTLFDLLGRAQADLKNGDSSLVDALARNPLGTCQQWGVAVNADAVKVWLGYEPDSLSDPQLLEILVSRLQGKQCSV
jgi:hypothetical protein